MSIDSSLLTVLAGGLFNWLGIAFIVGYLFGSIPFGLLLTRWAGHGDLRNIGSGNIGATNVLRTGDKKLAAATLVLDALKATAAVLLVNHWYGQGVAVIAGLGAFIGHLYPVWLKFRGGKGVATYIGILLGALPTGAFVFCGLWLATALILKFSSLAALTASLITPVVLFLIFQQKVLAGVSAVMTVLLWWKHRANIKRLLQGKEPRIGAKA